MRGWSPAIRLQALHPAALATLIFYAAVITTTTVAQAGREQQTQQEIEALQEKIASIQEGIERKRTERDVMQTRLRNTELELASLDQSLADIKITIETEVDQLLALDQERKSLRSSSEKEQQHLSDEMRSIWLMNQGGGLRLLFGDQDPDQLALNLVYFERLLEAREASLERFAELIRAADKNREALSASQKRLAQQRSQLEEQRQRQTLVQSERKSALSDILRSLNQDNGELKKLQADATALTALLEEIRSALSELDLVAPVKPFSNAKDSMVYPITGKPSNRYGARRNASDMRWRGWLIPAAEGSDVQAIYHGQVVYADWLRGQGLLVIIDHGDGFLSLYGHNRSLQRSVGDKVNPGEIIAQVGTTGGLDRAALYFEIREAGNPVDPSLWLHP